MCVCLCVCYFDKKANPVTNLRSNGWFRNPAPGKQWWCIHAGFVELWFMSADWWDFSKWTHPSWLRSTVDTVLGGSWITMLAVDAEHPFPRWKGGGGGGICIFNPCSGNYINSLKTWIFICSLMFFLFVLYPTKPWHTLALTPNIYLMHVVCLCLFFPVRENGRFQLTAGSVTQLWQTEPYNGSYNRTDTLTMRETEVKRSKDISSENSGSQ